jgi:lipoprotein-releasing system permease protein
MNGFQSEIKRNLVEIQGEIRVEGYEIIEDIKAFEKFLMNFEEIEAIAPYGRGVIMLMRDGHSIFPFIKGITANELAVTGVGQMLKSCSLKDLDNDHIIVGEQLALQMGLRVSDMVELYSPLALEFLQNDNIIFPREVKVAGFFVANDYDKNTILCSLERIQDLYELGEGAHGFTIKLHSGYSVERFALKLQEQLGSAYRVTDWVQGNSNLLFALRWEKTMMFFVLLFILLVASFSISSMLITNVVRKTREIGIIIAIGGNRCGIARCFFLQGLFVGIIGTCFGIIGGMSVLYFRDEIVKFTNTILIGSSAQNYLSQFTHLPVTYHMSDFIIIGLFSILICILSGVIPGLRATRICPAKALHYEQ